MALSVAAVISPGWGGWLSLQFHRGAPRALRVPEPRVPWGAPCRAPSHLPGTELVGVPSLVGGRIRLPPWTTDPVGTVPAPDEELSVAMEPTACPSQLDRLPLPLRPLCCLSPILDPLEEAPAESSDWERWEPPSGPSALLPLVPGQLPDP